MTTSMPIPPPCKARIPPTTIATQPAMLSFIANSGFCFGAEELEEEGFELDLTSADAGFVLTFTVTSTSSTVSVLVALALSSNPPIVIPANTPFSEGDYQSDP